MGSMLDFYKIQSYSAFPPHISIEDREEPFSLCSMPPIVYLATLSHPKLNSSIFFFLGCRWLDTARVHFPGGEFIFGCVDKDLSSAGPSVWAALQHREKRKK